MDENTRIRLAAFSANFRARRAETAQRKDALSREKTYTITRRVKAIPIGGLDGGEDSDALRIAKLRDDLNWTPLAVLVTGQWQECQCCGHRAIATSGFFYREQHNTIRSAKRLRSINHIPDDFKIELSIEGVVLQRCIKCLEGTIVDDMLAAMLNGNPIAVTNQLNLFDYDGR